MWLDLHAKPHAGDSPKGGPRSKPHHIKGLIHSVVASDQHLRVLQLTLKVAPRGSKSVLKVSSDGYGSVGWALEDVEQRAIVRGWQRRRTTRWGTW